MKNKRHVYEFLINPAEKVCVELYESGGRFNVSVDLRFPLDEFCDYWEPTINAFTIEAEHIAELIKALEKAFCIYQTDLKSRDKEGESKAN